MARLGGTPSRAARTGGTLAVDGHTVGEPARRNAIEPYERACCCTAPPVVRAVFIATTPAVHSVDLLLCGHHYRSSAPKLSTIGAMIFDRDGYLIALDENMIA